MHALRTPGKLSARPTRPARRGRQTRVFAVARPSSDHGRSNHAGNTAPTCLDRHGPNAGNDRVWKLLSQWPGTLASVLDTTRQAAQEVLTALDPMHSSQPAAHRQAAAAGAEQCMALSYPPQQQRPQQPEPQPLKNISNQALRLAKGVADIAGEVGAEAQQALEDHGPRLTAAGVRLVGKKTAAAGVEVIGDDNTAKAIGLLGSTNAAAATEELGVFGTLRVLRRLGPVGIVKVVRKLGPRGVMNLMSHILARCAHSVRAYAANLSTAGSYSTSHPEASGSRAAAADIGEGSQSARRIADGTARTGNSSSSSSDGSSQHRAPMARSPAVALLAAMVQVLLAAVAGALQSMSNLLHRGVKLWDELHNAEQSEDDL